MFPCHCKSATYFRVSCGPSHYWAVLKNSYFRPCTLNSCVENNCTQRFIVQDYRTSIINLTIARTVNNYQLVSQIGTSNDLSPTVRENGSVNINLGGQATGFYLGIQDISSCLLIECWFFTTCVLQ